MILNSLKHFDHFVVVGLGSKQVETKLSKPGMPPDASHPESSQNFHPGDGRHRFPGCLCCSTSRPVGARRPLPGSRR